MKHREIGLWRDEQLVRQKFICPLCQRKISFKQAVADHDHVTGTLRMVLHRNCNGIEGRINHWAKRSKVDKKTFLRNVSDYWDKEFDNPIHPRHK